MQKISYTITTQSSLIVSPRANLAFYNSLDSSSEFKVIYPFYQYGQYCEYKPLSAEYYLPGSSVKGAVFRHNSFTTPGRLMVDDISIPNKYIVLRNLYKVQYLDKEQDACYDKFFPHVGVEMVKAYAELYGELYIDSLTAAQALLTDANKLTHSKMRKMCEYLCAIKGNTSYEQKLRNEIKKAVDNLSLLLKANDIFLLGGYKGLFHSIRPENLSQENSSAVFLDPETMLPHGLVKISLS